MSFQQDSYQNVRVAVLGAAGFIGRWVARALTAQGARLFLFVRDAVRAAETFAAYGVRGDIIELDLAVPGRWREALLAVRPTITFNLAEYGVDRTDRDDATAYRINTELVRQLAETLAPIRDSQWTGQDLVHVGSALEYGELRNDLAEDSTPIPTTLYGKSKLAGTEALAALCHERKLRALTARLFTVYGPGEPAGRLLPTLFEAARTRTPLPLTDGRQQRDFAYVADVAEGLLRLGVSPAKPGNIVNLATGRLTSVRQFAEYGAGVLKLSDGILQFGALPTRLEEMAHQPVAVTRLAALTSWLPPTSIPAGIRLAKEFETTANTSLTQVALSS